MGLVPGRYAVGVNVFTAPTIRVPYAPFWITDPAAPATPRVFEVTEHPPAIVDVRLPDPLRLITITGRVTDVSGAGTRGSVVLRATTSEDTVRAQTAPDGPFTLSAFEGQPYRLDASGMGRTDGRGSMDIPVGFDSTRPVVVRLSPQ